MDRYKVCYDQDDLKEKNKRNERFYEGHLYDLCRGIHG